MLKLQALMAFSDHSWLEFVLFEQWWSVLMLHQRILSYCCRFEFSGWIKIGCCSYYTFNDLLLQHELWLLIYRVAQKKRSSLIELSFLMWIKKCNLFDKIWWSTLRGWLRWDYQTFISCWQPDISYTSITQRRTLKNTNFLCCNSSLNIWWTSPTIKLSPSYAWQ